MVGLLHAMAFMVLLLVGWVIWNNKPLPLPKKTTVERWWQNADYFAVFHQVLHFSVLANSESRKFLNFYFY